jgi:hypothetical protein
MPVYRHHLFQPLPGAWATTIWHREEVQEAEGLVD